jgi:hypothetical protein
MCLCAIVAGDNSKARGRGWKVFSDLMCPEVGILAGWMHGGPLHYKSGFHIFLEKEDTLFLSHGEHIVKEVEWEGQCALGYDGASGASIKPVVVAERMRILPDGECSNKSVGKIDGRN